MECNLNNSPRDEVHAKHESHMARPLAPMSSTSSMALHSFLGRQWIYPFFSNIILFWRKVPLFENFGDFENMFSLFI
jgi:hypothetical protein